MVAQLQSVPALGSSKSEGRGFGAELVKMTIESRKPQSLLNSFKFLLLTTETLRVTDTLDLSTAPSSRLAAAAALHNSVRQCWERLGVEL